MKNQQPCSADLNQLSSAVCELAQWVRQQETLLSKTPEDFKFWLPVTKQKILDFGLDGVQAGDRLCKLLEPVVFDNELIEHSERNVTFSVGLDDITAHSALEALWRIADRFIELRLETSKALTDRLELVGKFASSEPDGSYHPDWIQEFTQSEFWWPMRPFNFSAEIKGVSVSKLKTLADAELRAWWKTQSKRTRHTLTIGDKRELLDQLSTFADDLKLYGAKSPEVTNYAGELLNRPKSEASSRLVNWWNECRATGDNRCKDWLDLAMTIIMRSRKSTSAPLPEDYLSKFETVVGKLNEHLDAVVCSPTEAEPAPTGKSEAESEPVDFEKLNGQMPKLDLESGDWVQSKKENQKILALAISSLNKYRQVAKGGLVSPCEMYGQDKDGRFWRRQGTPRSAVYYLKSTLPETGD